MKPIRRIQRMCQVAAVVVSVAAPWGCAGAEPVDGSTAPTSDPNANANANAGPGQPGQEERSVKRAELNPGPAWAKLVIGAKALEEGDADLVSASRDYATIVSIFEQLRTVAAEALHRQAIVEGRRKNENDARVAWERLARWFPDFEEKAQEAARALGTVAGAPAPETGAATAFATMSPELMRRYGLVPQSSGAGQGAAAGAGEGSGEGSSAPRTRYGTTSAAAPGDRSSATDPHATERTLLEQTRADLLMEAVKARAERRRASAELNRVHGASAEQLPPTLVSDARMRQLIEALHEPPAPALSKELAERAQLERARQAERYLHEVYLPRLNRILQVSERESENLLEELQKIDNQLGKLPRIRTGVRF